MHLFPQVILLLLVGGLNHIKIESLWLKLIIYAWTTATSQQYLIKIRQLKHSLQEKTHRIYHDYNWNASDFLFFSIVDVCNTCTHTQTCMITGNWMALPTGTQLILSFSIYQLWAETAACGSWPIISNCVWKAVDLFPDKTKPLHLSLSVNSQHVIPPKHIQFHHN